MGMTLYEIADEFSFLVDKEDLTEEDMTRLDELGTAIEVKAGNIMAVTDKLGYFVTMCKAEEKRISARRKAAENRIIAVNNYLQGSMEAADVYTIEVGTRKLAVQKNPPKVVIDAEEEIPARFFEIVPESTRLDKIMLKAALKSGSVTGAHLEQTLSLRKR